MTRKRRVAEREARRKAWAEREKLAAQAEGYAVDPSALAPNNSYGQPEFVERGYYVDKPFVCRDCGTLETWTAAQQKWWYEVAKGYAYSSATRCRECRRREKARKERARIQDGDPNPYRNAGLLLAKIRSEIEPNLTAAGLRFLGRNSRLASRVRFVDYGREDELFTLSWDRDRARLSAERLVHGGDDLKVVAEVVFPVASASDVQARLAPFLDAVREFLSGGAAGDGD